MNHFSHTGSKKTITSSSGPPTYPKPWLPVLIRLPMISMSLKHCSGTASIPMGSWGQWFMGTTLGQEVPMETVQFWDLEISSSPILEKWKLRLKKWNKTKSLTKRCKGYQKDPEKEKALSSKRHFFELIVVWVIVSRKFWNKKHTQSKMVALCSRNDLRRYYDRLFKEPLSGDLFVGSGAMRFRSFTSSLCGCPQVSHFESLNSTTLSLISLQPLQSWSFTWTSKELIYIYNVWDIFLQTSKPKTLRLPSIFCHLRYVT